MTAYKKIALLFPGQGAQYVEMGKDFAATFPVARQTLEEADDLLGRRLSKVMMEGPEPLLTETRNSQAAIYVMSVALLRVLKEVAPQLQPSVCAGLSLGEYTALHASGRISFAACLELIQHRSNYMNAACEKKQGAMAVILGLNGDVVEALVKEVNLPHDLWAANFNSPGQVVISGTLKGIEAGSAAAKAKGAKRVLPLQVHGAFHSGLMQEAGQRLTPHINHASLHASAVDIVMNVPGDRVSETELIRSYLIQQVTHPVRWEQGIRHMDTSAVDLFIEIGCGKTLTGFNKRIGVIAPTLSIEKVEDLELLQRTLS
jgi:[acyl-carrier-protein] S-malonyltransferase